MLPLKILSARHLSGWLTPPPSSEGGVGGQQCTSSTLLQSSPTPSPSLTPGSVPAITYVFAGIFTSRWSGIAPDSSQIMYYDNCLPICLYNSSMVEILGFELANRFSGLTTSHLSRGDSQLGFQSV
jgi:hypothetical protein